jgi:hypothetical protein
MGVLDEYFLSFHLEGHTLERGTDAGPLETLSGCRLEGRTMIGAYEVAPVDSKKLIFHPIQRNADVRGSDSRKHKGFPGSSGAPLQGEARHR